MSFFDLQDFAGRNYQKVYDYLYPRAATSPRNILVGTIFTCIAADGQFSQSEWQFIQYFVGDYSYDDALATAAIFQSSRSQQQVREYLNALPAEIKEAYLNLCVAILALDKHCDVKERQFFLSLF